ncbi:hypothetical protein GOP47_0030431 [Adiantum capillus-veneris]|nr:hypothetical protein GOP47_0030431 [Adiantum capillus-veneris]
MFESDELISFFFSLSLSLSLSEMEEGCSCSCSLYEYALTRRNATSEKVFAIRRQGSEEVEEICLSIDHAYILACQKQATELLKGATECDRVAVGHIFDTCSLCSFDELHTALKAFRISPATPSSPLQKLAVYEIVEVAADAAVVRPDLMQYDAQLGVEGVVEEWMAKEKSRQETKVYRVVCSQECETPGSQLYGSKHGAYAAAIVKQAAMVSHWKNYEVEEREDCLRILEDMKGKPLEDQHGALLKQTAAGSVLFHVEELVVSCSSDSDDANAAVAVMMERAVTLLRNREEIIYLVKSSPLRLGRSRARKVISYRPINITSKDESGTILHGAFRDSKEAYSFALAMQVRDILHHATDMANKEPIHAMLARLMAAAEEPKEEAFAFLKSWIIEENVHLTRNSRSFVVQKLVVKNIFEDNKDGFFREEIEQQFYNWEKQFYGEL